MFPRSNDAPIWGQLGFARQFAIRKAEPDDCGLIDSYHPSYTFKHGNQTSFSTTDNGGLK